MHCGTKSSQSRPAIALTLKTLFNEVQPLPGFRVSDCKLLKAKEIPEIHVWLAPDARRKPRCECSDAGCPGYDTQPERSWDFVPLWQLKVKLRYAPRRVMCKQCGVKVEAMPWSVGKHAMASAMILFLATWGKRLAWKQVASIFRVSWESVYRSIAHVVDYGLKHRVLGHIEAIGVDELHWAKGKKAENFVTLIYQIDEGRRKLLHVGLKRTEKTLRDGIKSLGESAQTIRFVCSDMWKAYLKVIAKELPQAINILDRYHIAAHLNKAVDEVRRGEVNRLRKAGDKSAAQALKGSRYALLSRRRNMSAAAKRKLNEVRASKGQTGKAWMWKEVFDHFWKYNHPGYALAYLDAWVRRVMRTRIEPMIRVAKMLRKHRHLLGNYFIAKKQYNSGVVEGLNLKCNLVKRRAYGLRTYKALEMALYHNLGDLPEPSTTHRFC
jgi:transposase